MNINIDAVAFLLIFLTVLLFGIGIFKTLFEKNVAAQENIERLSRGKTQAQSARTRFEDGEILKKRDKNRSSRRSRMETKLERANVLLKVEEFTMISFGCALLGFLFGFLATGFNIFLAFLFIIPGYFLPSIYLWMVTAIRMGKAEETFADVLDSMVNCFKTGYGFNKAVQVISENYDDPWGTEFGKMSAEASLGASQEEVLNGLGRRMPSPDVDMFITAMMIQKETGGNMSELIGSLSNTVRDRFKLKRKVSAISAQGKLSAVIVSLIPLILSGIMAVFLPEPFGKFVTNPIGIVVLVICGIWMLVGVKVLFKIVQIEV